jgi:hypothetical protein
MIPGAAFQRAGENSEKYFWRKTPELGCFFEVRAAFRERQRRFFTLWGPQNRTIALF